MIRFGEIDLMSLPSELACHKALMKEAGNEVLS